MILDRINAVSDLRSLGKEELERLAEEIRQYIIEVISKNGGHLASSLGVVELTIALHYVFNTPQDKIIWDVGHQCYAHKILTGRRELFPGVRTYRGISGFPKKKESEFDVYNAGHSSTSLSLALGESVGRDLKGEDYKVLAVIGDGSLTGGMAFEALNQIGHMQNDVIIILNDNEHSISKNVGALSNYLTRMITGSLYNRFRRKSMNVIRDIPRIGEKLYSVLLKFFGSFKGMLITGRLFEDLGIRYFGPVDGNNLEKMLEVMESLKEINSGPKIVHVITKKGKGYLPAEMDPARFHGIGPFDIETGNNKSINKCLSYSEVAGKTLAHFAKKDKSIIAITAAMKLGTGLNEFEKAAPDRFFDVGIAEQHGITFAAALASTGLKPFVSIYSTFVQRAIDQIVHDVAIMNLPVRILIDRSGIVGDDGETHHGVFDIALIRNIPNIIFLAPSSGEELRDMISYACSYNDGPIAIRYPRGRIDAHELDFKSTTDFVPGKAKRISRGKDVAIFTLGDMVKTATEVSSILKKEGILTSVVNLRSIKPLDTKMIRKTVQDTTHFITLENGVVSGGVGEYILSHLESEYRNRLLFSAGFPDEFIPHGSVDILFRDYGLDPESLAERIIAAKAAV